MQLLLKSATFFCLTALALIVTGYDATAIRALSMAVEQTINPPKLLIEEDFNGKNPFGQVHQQFGTDHAFTVVDDPAGGRNKVGRFELREEDPIQSNGKRSEVLFPPQDNNDRWYSYSVYVPSEHFNWDHDNDIISQWHQATGGSPATTFRIHQDRFMFRTGNKKATRKDYYLGKVDKDQWHHFIFHIIHDHGKDGLVEVWQNGEKILEHKGGNMYDTDLPRWKVGIYKASWAKRKTNSTKRVIYFDNIKLGSEQTSFDDLALAIQKLE
ncbi:polysaccharide lyase [Litoribacter populi]|uniref:polysaccharide lyase n=1 Tax=Litoribacter populi TaxID=2598460 RepID=UPI00117FB4B7|nr:polysaccharide lyase [Litoribacter populi]